MMKNIAVVVLLVAVIGLIVRDQSTRADLKIAKQETVKAKQEVVELMENRIWAETQDATPPIPKKYKDEFINLLRFALSRNESEEAVARQAFVEFRERVFPGSSDAEAFAWAFNVKGMDELAEQYKLLSVRVASLK